MNKLLKTMGISLLTLILGGAATLVIMFYVVDDESTDGNQSLEQMVEYSYETPEMTTDLEDGSFVRIQFKILTDGKKAKEELELREFQLKNMLIKELVKMNEENFQTGLDDLEETLQTKLNDVMMEGTVTDVYTISKILQ